MNNEHTATRLGPVSGLASDGIHRPDRLPIAVRQWRSIRLRLLTVAGAALELRSATKDGRFLIFAIMDDRKNFSHQLPVSPRASNDAGAPVAARSVAGC
jgi:hypothetical protein